MKCPFCGSMETRVINSRPANGGESIRRRRECEVCNGRFTTFETIEEVQYVVVKRDGTHVPYSRDRLLSGVTKACSKRPVSPQQIDHLVRWVEKEIFGNQSKEVTAEQIGRLVLKRLKDLDQVAYIRFASVYKDFRDLQDFYNEIKAMLKE